MNENSYDAIVVGTGISGGWAAKELTEKGLKTLVLDRGRMVKHGEYPTATKDPWDFPYAGRATADELKRHSIGILHHRHCDARSVAEVHVDRAADDGDPGVT